MLESQANSFKPQGGDGGGGGEKYTLHTHIYTTKIVFKIIYALFMKLNGNFSFVLVKKFIKLKIAKFLLMIVLPRQLNYEGNFIFLSPKNVELKCPMEIALGLTTALQKKYLVLLLNSCFLKSSPIIKIEKK